MSTNVPAGPSSADLDRRIIRSSAWVAIAHASRTGLSMLSVLVLVRLLEPEAFGLVALAATFVTVLELIQASGMTAAFIYRRDDLRAAAGSALVFSTVGGILLCALSVAAAPLFAQLARMPEATDVIRVMAVLLVIRGLGIVPGAILEKGLDFRSRARGEVAAAVSQIGVAVGLAAAGFGVWSLVAGQLVAAFVQTTAFWVLAPWRPSPRAASLGVMREMVRYGRFVSAGNLLALFNSTLQNVIVGRLLGATALGFYTVTFRLADLPTSAIGYIVGRVMLPAYSLVQDDRETFRRAFLSNLQRVAMFSLPVAVTLAVAAEPLVRTLLGEEWLAVVTPLRLVALYSIVRSFASTAGAVFQALGKPHLVPVFALPHSAFILPALLLLTPRYGVTGAALAMLISFSLAGIPALAAAFRLLGLGVVDATRTLGSLVICSAAAGATMLVLLPAVDSLPAPAALALVLAGGALTYLAGIATLGRGAVAPVWAGLRSQPG